MYVCVLCTCELYVCIYNMHAHLYAIFVDTYTYVCIFVCGEVRISAGACFVLDCMNIVTHMLDVKC